jgi:hypothetical protein
MANNKVKFMDLPVDAIFTFENNKYKKIQEERISCCTVINAVSTTNAEQKVNILPLIEVEVETA